MVYTSKDEILQDEVSTKSQNSNPFGEKIITPEREEFPWDKFSPSKMIKKMYIETQRNLTEDGRIR